MSRGYSRNSSPSGGGGVSYSRLLIDTTNLLATDVVRVRSMIDPTQVWNRTVTTPGDYIIFDVPGMDQYKISLVQEIEQVETEVLNLYEDVGCGWFKTINILDKTHLSGIQNILNNHREQDLLSLRDEVIIKTGGSDWIMEVAAIDLYNSHEVILCSKYIFASTVLISTGGTVMRSTNIINILDNTFYSGMDENDKMYVKQTNRQARNGNGSVESKTCYAFLPNYNELINTTSIVSYTIPVLTFPNMFDTNNKRIKTLSDGTVSSWWLQDMGSGANGNFYAYGVTATGAVVANYPNGLPENSSNGVVPCIRLEADV